MKKTLLPDVNVWLALVFNAHAHHPSALAWFNSLSGETCHFCRLTQLGFLRRSFILGFRSFRGAQTARFTQFFSASISFSSSVGSDDLGSIRAFKVARRNTATI